MDKKEIDELNRISREHRRKNFRVRIRKPGLCVDIHPETVDLEITPNGNQWTSITLFPDEIPKVIKALQGIKND